MSEPVQPLGGASYSGFATVREIGPLGMVTLRARPDTPGLAGAVQAAVGTALPAPRRIGLAGDRACGWMSPDEYLMLSPYGETGAIMAQIGATLGGSHHLAANVSDARAVFRVEGAGAETVLSRLCPVDFPGLVPGELRRTRLAQVACALWRDGEGYTVVTFRSVARYAFDILANAAR